MTIPALTEWQEARKAFLALPANDPSAKAALNRLSEAEHALAALSLSEREPAGYRWRFEDSETWSVQKNKPAWYTPDQRDIVLEPLFT